MWQFREVWNCKLGDMIFQSSTFFTLALGVQKFERKLVGGYCTTSLKFMVGLVHGFHMCVHCMFKTMEVN